MLRLLIVHTLAYLLIGLLSWCCTLIAPLRWWDLGLYLSFYPEWDKLLVQPWSLVTYALPHLNLFHFLGNMCLLYVLLPAMEQRLGARHFLTAYVGGIIAGSLAYLLAYQIVGASLLPPLSLQGASAALLSALVAGIVYDRRLLSSFALRFFGQRLSPLYYCRRQKVRPDAGSTHRAQLLEQARHSGFASLSPAERRSLMKYSHVPHRQNEHPHD